MSDKLLPEKADEIKRIKVLAYCEQCGYPIYDLDEAIVINSTEDIIHKECWTDYSIEHMFSFAVPASLSEFAVEL